MKHFLLGIIYTIIVAGFLAHFSGCDMPEGGLEALLTPPATVTQAPGKTDVNPSDVQEATTRPINTPNASAEETPSVKEAITPCDDYVWTTGSVNMREGASKDYEKVGVVPTDTKVHRTGICDNGWIRIEYKDVTAYISGKYYTTTAPTPTPTVTFTPAPKATAAANPTATGTPKLTPAANITSTPTPGSSQSVIDDVHSMVARFTSVGSNVNLESASGFYFETEKTATSAFMKNASDYTRFTMLYKDESCMHTPEYFMANYPEFYSVKVDYENSKKYNNAIYVVFDVGQKEGGQYAYAVRTGNTSFLNEQEAWALKEVIRLSDELELSKYHGAELIRVVHDYIIENTKYDSTYAEISHTPYGLLKNKTAVCDGYSETFLMFMLLNDIECQVVTGYANESHAWNQVCLNGKWYNVDVTWDDPVSTGSEVIDTLRYDYFMVNDSVLYKTHTPECGYEKKCTDDGYHMYTYKQYMCTSEDEVRGQINRQLNNPSIYIVYKKGAFTKNEIISIFQKMYNVALSSYAPVEIREGYMLYEIITPNL